MLLLLYAVLGAKRESIAACWTQCQLRALGCYLEVMRVLAGGQIHRQRES